MARDANTRPAYAPAVVEGVLDAILRHAPLARRPRLIGVSGLQGSGKSTLARQLAAAASGRGIAAVALSIDDCYLGRRARGTLARDVHPLFATRGVPGTHDLGLLEATLAALATASAAHPARLPRFDKGRDTRIPPSRWRRVTHAPRLILLDGWCIGVPPQADAALVRPCNRLERDEDAAAIWRRRVNLALRTGHARLRRRLDVLVLLQAPSWHVVGAWRDEAERALRERRAPRAMTPRQLARFLQHHERLSRHALRTLPARADIRIALDRARGVRAIVESESPRRAVRRR
jgi:D-glycerate 3-kinase